MRIIVACVGKAGRAKHDAVASLIEEYRSRLPWPVDIREVEDKRPGSVAEKKAREATLLRAALQAHGGTGLPPGAPIVALDEHGKNLSSRDFAGQIGAWRDEGSGGIGFVIGGADGLDAGLLAETRLKIAFGAMTWPHLLARMLLLEQLYRAWSLLNNHPYHRD
ncbi:23S rRNA (pseudouridine(1915)-N(3))-methyltransferase RlmH [Ferrovibrio sp.]|uniref:23S rRNA (pseudouridine(1915)-N(3))-methyltransferase RlmH n=1 Tax=Ferrovibrio sp. TaxID=1917215 RepID=UPI0025C4B4AE|nr:23S rRNA (pseudouridine(1915)-N(3))-methyltransferase RlmH [Ferrovibrio sp.]MBX3453841.1 23S rRNA (pseudouridine(1915)-N(3))-methyltransferase RlmH [Ferrovibrio sp.]